MHSSYTSHGIFTSHGRSRFFLHRRATVLQAPLVSGMAGKGDHSDKGSGALALSPFLANGTCWIPRPPAMIVLSSSDTQLFHSVNNEADSYCAWTLPHPCPIDTIISLPTGAKVFDGRLFHRRSALASMSSPLSVNGPFGPGYRHRGFQSLHQCSSECFPWRLPHRYDDIEFSTISHSISSIASSLSQD